jgi:hypothetical protein
MDASGLAGGLYSNDFLYNILVGEEVTIRSSGFEHFEPSVDLKNGDLSATRTERRRRDAKGKTEHWGMDCIGEEFMYWHL